MLIIQTYNNANDMIIDKTIHYFPPQAPPSLSESGKDFAKADVRDLAKSSGCLAADAPLGAGDNGWLPPVFLPSFRRLLRLLMTATMISSSSCTNNIYKQTIYNHIVNFNWVSQITMQVLYMYKCTTEEVTACGSRCILKTHYV